MSASPAPSTGPDFGSALRTWLYVGLNSFGGPAGQIAVMHREIVERRRWLSERRFLHALNYCMLLPGPEAQQLATYIGWLLHGLRGGLAAGLLFIAPGVVAIMALSIVYALFEATAPVQALFYGIKPAVVAVIVMAMLAIGRRVLVGRAALAIALAAFVAIFFFDVAFPLIVGGAALAGWLTGRRRPIPADVASAQDEPPPRPAVRRALLLLAGGLALWLAPAAVLWLLLGPDSVFSQLVLFFSVVALVTFGGAYAVLAYVAQEVVGSFGWLTPGQMLDGLGLAESTPGPLIMVVQFVGFLAAFAVAGPLDPLAAGIAGGLLVTWVTFVPSFTWIFAGAPFVEQLHGRPQLTALLGGITAAVVGVILNLALWFALQTLFGQTGELHVGPLRLHTVELATLDVAAAALVGLALVLLHLRVPLLLTLAICAGLGFGYHMLLAG